MNELNIKQENYKDIELGDILFEKNFEWTCTYIGTIVRDGNLKLVGETLEGELILSDPNNFIPTKEFKE